MKGNICAIVRWHYKAFQIFCFSPISLNANEKVVRVQEFLWLIWSLFVILCLNLLISAYITFNDISIYAGDNFGLVIDYIQMFTTSLGTQITILEPLFKKKYERIFWRQYIRLSSVRQLVSTSFSTQVKEYKSFIFKFYVYFILNQIVECVVLISISESFNILLVYWILFHSYTYLLRLRTMHFIFYLDLVTVEMHAIDNDLQLLVEYTEFGMHRKTFPRFDEFIRLRIVEKQKMYEDIFEMVESFKKANGLAIIANYFKYYVRTLVNCYWVFWTWNNSHLSTQDILLIPAILEIPMFLLTAKSCMTAANDISYRVHNLKHSAENLAVSTQIQNFSLQLLHQKIKIDGLGIASMDGYMLTKAIGSITTYMVFFIQFMPKFKSKFD